MIKNYGAGILNIKSFLPHFLILINSSFDYPKNKKMGLCYLFGFNFMVFPLQG